MATISHISADGPTLGCSNMLLSGITERALPHTQDRNFVTALEESKWPGDINFYLFSAEYQLIFAKAADALADEVSARSNEFPEYVTRVRHSASEIRKTVEKEVNL